MRRLPARFEPPRCPLPAPGLTSRRGSGIAAGRALDVPPDFVPAWLASWRGAWRVAFPAVTVVAPVVRGVVACRVEPRA